ncbi:MAG: phospholipid carrier-dependent glycosyltransferase [bacterium]|nr:phospholipid carrier-dependent glycosyltransferase [bacterium]
MKRFYTIILFLIAFLLLMLLFLYKLEAFPVYVFDETYYVDAAAQLYRGNFDPNTQHPPLGKALISLPFYFMPISAFSWRFSAVIFGLTGLLVLYVFSRKIELSRMISLLCVLLLVGSRGWYIISRLGMLEIFVAVLILLSAFSFYLYLRKHQFRRDYTTYSSHGLLYLTGVLVGIGGAIKWNAFFLLGFIFFIFLFYFESKVYKRAIYFLFVLFLSLYAYIFIVSSMYSFDPSLLAGTTITQLVIHNSSMLPENAFVAHPNSISSLGGGAAVLTFLLGYVEYDMGTPEYGKYIFSNNPIIPYSFVLFSVYVIYEFIKNVYKAIRYRDKTVSFVLKDKDIMYCYWVSVFMIIPWIFIPRIQYIYYYIPAYPFIVLFMCIFLYRYSRRFALWSYVAVYIVGLLWTLRSVFIL